MNHPFCPSCGFNLNRDEPITRGRWELGPNWIRVDGAPCTITAQQSAILYTVAAAKGPGVKMDALLNRVSDSHNSNVIEAQLSRLRRLFGPAMPVKYAPGRGYQWVGEQ